MDSFRKYEEFAKGIIKERIEKRANSPNHDSKDMLDFFLDE